ncbi:MAG: extracellular solute-binding protein [Alphaproteobacteria bacterium]|nr:extracellular solute-binding protein [Alphaproteobacteria bacterium]
MAPDRTLTRGDGADVAMVAGEDFDAVARHATLANIPLAALPNLADYLPGLHHAPGIGDGSAMRYVPIEWFPISVVFRADLAPAYTARESWELLWDPTFVGRIAMPRDAATSVLIAGVYAGVNVYAPSELEQAKIGEALARQRGLAVRYEDDLAVLVAALARGELVAAAGPNALFAALRPVSGSAAFIHPREGLIVRVRGAVVRDGSERRPRTTEMVDALLDPRYVVCRIRRDGIAGANQRSFGLVEGALLAANGLDRDIGAELD